MQLFVASFAALVSVITISLMKGRSKFWFTGLIVIINELYVWFFAQNIYDQAIAVIQLTNWKAVVLFVPFALIFLVTLLMATKSLEVFLTQWMGTSGFDFGFTVLSCVVFIASLFAVIYEVIWFVGIIG